MNPLKCSTSIREKLTNNRSTHAAAPILHRYVQTPSSSDCVVARKRIEIQTADAANSLASPRNISLLSRPRVAITTIAPLPDEARHDIAPVGNSVGLQIDQLREADKRFNDKITSHSAAVQLQRGASAWRNGAFAASAPTVNVRWNCLGGIAMV